MGENYHSDMGGGPEDQRLSSLRSSLISPNAAYLAQQQQWNQGGHATSWNITDEDFEFANQYPHYQQQQQQQQQQQWIIDQYAPSGEQSFMHQNSYWGGYEPQGQQMLGSSDHDAMDMDQTNAGLQSNDNKVGIDGNIRKENESHEASNNHLKHHSANHSARENENPQGKTPPTEYELQMKRAAAIASLQKRTASAGASGNESTPPRGTPPQNAAQEVTTAKEGKSSGAQRSLFQTGDKIKTKREPNSADCSSPIERTTKQSFTDGKIGSSALKTPSNGSFHYQKKDDQEAKKGTAQRASSIDIDGLLAEGRAAAEASQKSETNGDGKSLASPKLGVHRKVGSKKERDAEVGSYRRNSLASAVSSDPSEMGEIRDEPVHQHLTSQSKPKEKEAIPASSKDLDVGRSKSHSSRPSNGLSKNPTTKTDTFIDNKESKQTNNQLGDSEKRRFGCDSRAPKDLDSTPQTSRHDSTQSSQPRVEKPSVSKWEPRSAEKTKKPQGLHSRPDRPIYEPTRHPSRYKAFDQPSKEPIEKNESDRAPTTGHQYPKTTDTRTPRDSRKSAPEDTKPGFDNSFAHLNALEVEELREWLVLTGYHDEAFRRKTMQRHRRLAVLEQERAELLKEEQEERGALTNARSQSFISPDAPAVPGTPSLSFAATMPPPKSVNKNDNTPKSFTPSGGWMGASNSVADGSPAGGDSRSSRTPLLKRRLSASTGHDSDMKPVEKVARTGLVTDAPNNQDSSQDRHREFSGSRRDRDSRDGKEDGNVKLTKGKLTMDGMNEERREALIRRRSSGSVSPNGREKDNDRQNRMRREWSESSEYKDYGPAPTRGRGRGRFHRGSHRGTPFFKPHRSERKGDGNDLDLRLGDVQYFMVKSWTYDNVEISQREGTWATQAKNMDKFSQAFEECRHVILLFSVNNSKAFQGYARMESSLGAPGVRAPSWAQDLVWEPSPPFRIRWITINETRFRYVGHLKNSYNEDEPVLVGRDGQEIEPRCGQSLCEILDNENPNTQANPSWVKPHNPTPNKTW